MSSHPPTDLRRPEGVETRPLGWWGMLLTAAVVITTYAAMYFTYAYVRVASESWPPAGIDPPDLTLPGLALASLVASAVPMGWAARAAAARTWGSTRLALVATLVLGGLHVGLVMADWAGQAFAVDTHVYGSLYYVLPGIHAVVLGIGMLVAAVLTALTWSGAATAPGMVHVGTMSLRVYWYAVVIGGVVLLAVVYGLPHVWQETIAP